MVKICKDEDAYILLAYGDRSPSSLSLPVFQAAKEMTRAREKALEESGLSHGHITEAISSVW